jgi:hypothetical protein
VTGRKLWLYENTAPTGWTIASVTDGVIAVKGGSDAYNVNGIHITPTKNNIKVIPKSPQLK